MPGDEGKTGGVPVKAVDAAENKGNTLLVKIPCERIGNCVVVVPHGRVDRHSGGLVDDHEVFILVDLIFQSKCNPSHIFLLHLL